MDQIHKRLVNFEEVKLPETIYKYRDWNDKYHKTIITDLQVYMSAPLDFEDKMDCKNHVRYDLLTEDEIHWKYYTESKKDRERTHLPETEHQKFAEEWFKKSPLHDKDNIKKLQEKDFVDFNARTGILCLTANPVRQEMWSKYSKDHTGFCVGFNPKVMFKYLGGGQEVIYCDQLPIIKPSPWDDFTVQMIKQIYHKERKWEFEEEYRTQTFQYEPLTAEARVVTLPIEAYKEIVFGAKTPQSMKEEIMDISKKLLPHLKFKQAEITSDKIVIKEINSSIFSGL